MENDGRSHKDEVRAVLASEPGLVEEVEFDLRRFEKEEQEQKKAKVQYSLQYSRCLRVVLRSVFSIAVYIYSTPTLLVLRSVYHAGSLCRCGGGCSCSFSFYAVHGPPSNASEKAFLGGGRRRRKRTARLLRWAK